MYFVVFLCLLQLIMQLADFLHHSAPNLTFKVTVEQYKGGGGTYMQINKKGRGALYTWATPLRDCHMRFYFKTNSTSGACTVRSGLGCVLWLYPPEVGKSSFLGFSFWRYLLGQHKK